MREFDEQARAVVKNLLQADESQLYEKLGMTMEAIRADVAVAGSLDPHVTYQAAMMGPLDSLCDLGKRIFYRWNKEAYRLVCGGDPQDKNARQDLLKAMGMGEVAAAGALTGLLVAYLAISPPIAAIIAAIVIKRFFNSAYEEFCGVWGESLK